MFPTKHEYAMEPDALRHAFGAFPSGVTAFCALVDGKPEGITASSFTSVSLRPPLVAVCVADTSSTWPKLERLDRFGLSILGSEHGDVARNLASRSSDRFSDVDWHATERGAVFVRGASLWLECAPHDVVHAGDHYIVILEVVWAASAADVPPMVFHQSTFWGLAPPA